MYRVHRILSVGIHRLSNNQLHGIRGLHHSHTLDALPKKGTPTENKAEKRSKFDSSGYGLTDNTFDFFAQVSSTDTSKTRKPRKVDLGNVSKIGGEIKSITGKSDYQEQNSTSAYLELESERTEKQKQVNKNIQLKRSSITKQAAVRKNKKLGSDEAVRLLSEENEETNNSIISSEDASKSNPQRSEKLRQLVQTLQLRNNNATERKPSTQEENCQDESLLHDIQINKPSNNLTEYLSPHESKIDEFATVDSKWTASNDEWPAMDGELTAANGEMAAAKSEWAAADDDWADSFGTLSEDYKKPLHHVSSIAEEYEAEHDEDTKNPHIRLRDVYVDKTGQYNANHFAIKIKQLGAEGKVYEAIEVLETEMLKEKRLKPNGYVFSTLIGVLARVGYTQKAFAVFKKMRDYGFWEKSAYTALFNSCANHPDKAEGLRLAHDLRQSMMLDPKMTLVHEKTYAAMIKTFGMCGDIEMAFALVDEYESTYFTPKQYLYTNVLIACAGDKHAGLKLAIEVWRRMRTRYTLYDVFLYNLFLRCIRDCGVGDPAFAQELIHGKHVPALEQASSTQLSTSDTQSRHIGFSGPAQLSSSLVSQRLINNDQYLNVGADNEYKQSDLNNVNTPFSGSTDTLNNCLETNHILSINSGNSASVQNIHNEQPQMNELIDTEPKSTNSKQHKEILDIHSEQQQMNELIETEPKSTNSKQHKDILELTPVNAQGLPAARVPNILNPKGNFSDVVALADLDTPQKRLQLFGGMQGILQHMQRDKVAPDIKTFTLLVEMIPENCESEQLLLDAMDQAKVFADVALLNLIIKRRSMRGDAKHNAEVLATMAERGLTPNGMTFGCIATGCKYLNRGMRLIHDMEGGGYVPNLTIYSTLLRNMKNRFDWVYTTQLLRSMRKHDIPPDQTFLTMIEQRLRTVRNIIVSQERGEPSSNDYFKSAEFLDGHREFLKYYSRWAHIMDVELPSDPWRAYKSPTQPQIDDFEDESQERKAEIKKGLLHKINAKWYKEQERRQKLSERRLKPKDRAKLEYARLRKKLYRERKMRENRESGMEGAGSQGYSRENQGSASRRNKENSPHEKKYKNDSYKRRQDTGDYSNNRFEKGFRGTDKNRNGNKGKSRGNIPSPSDFQGSGAWEKR